MCTYLIDFMAHLMTRSFFLGVTLFVCSVVLPSVARAQVIIVATTTVTVSRCGDLQVNGIEQCDFGPANASGYSLTIADRNCVPITCQWAPYCGDSITQFSMGEECDDGNNTSGDFCSNICIAEAVKTGGGGGGGGAFAGGSFSPPPAAQVTVRGKAYPNSDVSILKDGKVIGVVSADAKADFFFTTTNVTPGTATFGFWSEDGNGLRSVSFTTTFNVIQSAVTTVSGIFIPPTIKLDKRSVKRGEIVTMSGRSVPEVTVATVVHSAEEVVRKVESDDKGNWKLAFDTSVLADDIHTAKAQFELPVVGGAAVKSGFSQALTFFVGNTPTGGVLTADLNRDKKVNLIDFSILLFHWGTDGGASDPPADINQDGKVNLADFSIMLFNWTG
jgi:cysteine-rich repeat protein